MIDQINVLQKRALLAILLVNNRLIYSGVESIEIRWKKQAALFIFKLLHTLLPQFICNKIIERKYI